MEMRVIAGTAKGHRLKAPRAARPTSARVRAAIFSMLQSLASPPSRVLDLYAGSGALGIEALSRGAGWADFVEQDRMSCAIIKGNLEHTGLAGQGRVYCSRVKEALLRLGPQYDMVFLDPPYGDPALPSLLGELASSPLLEKGATVIVEHPPQYPLDMDYGPLHLIRQLHHGDTWVSVYKCNGRRAQD